MGFLLPRIHKQWTIPAHLLAKLLLLHAPCLSESTHLKFNRPFVEENNISNEFSEQKQNSRFHVLTLLIIFAPNQAESVPNGGGTTLIPSEM
jgi:hypothetical protein